MIRLKILFWRLWSQLYYKNIFASFGSKSVLIRPILIIGASRIWVGNNTLIRNMARLEVISRPEMGWLPTLKIGNQVNIEQGVHIVCQCEVTIEDDVSITPYCAIVDTYHPHDHPDQLPKIGDRLPRERTFVRIGAGTFIGIRSVILPNVSIGKGCVIGAGSVVTCDIDDYSVAVGVPARVISKFDITTKAWRRVAKEGLINET